MEVICDGDQVVLKVNDVQVNEAFQLKPSAGKLLIQVEGAELCVRRWDPWPVGKAPKLEPVRKGKWWGAEPERGGEPRRAAAQGGEEHEVSPRTEWPLTVRE